MGVNWRRLLVMAVTATVYIGLCEWVHDNTGNDRGDDETTTHDKVICIDGELYIQGTDAYWQAMTGEPIQLTPVD